MYWLERNLSQEKEDAATEETSSGGNQRGSKGKASQGGANNSSTPNNIQKKLGNFWSLSYVTSTGGSGGGLSNKSSSLRRVSFAPCDEAGNAGPSSPPKGHVDTVSSSSDDKDCDDYAVSEMLRVPSVPDREEMEMSAALDDQSIQRKSHSKISHVISQNSHSKKLGRAKSPVAKPRLPATPHSSRKEEKKVEVNSKGEATKPKEKPVYYLEPQLPPKDCLPPSPPPDIRHYARSSNPNILDHKIQLDDDGLSYHIKKKLLALKLQEKGAKRASRDRLHGVSSANSAKSDGITEKDLQEKEDKSGFIPHHPIFHSTPDSGHSLVDDADSIPTVYYTPKQSMIDCCSQDLDEGGESEMPIITSGRGDNGIAATSPEKPPSNAGSTISNSTHTSLISSSSAPSFLIESSTQLHQCIGTKDDDSSEKFKKVLDKLTTDNETAGKDSSEKFKKLFDKLTTGKDIQSTPQGNKVCLVDESWWEKFEKSYPEDSVDEPVSADEDDLSLTLSSEVTSSESPSVTYHQIDMEDLLRQIYPDSVPQQLNDSNDVVDSSAAVLNAPGNDDTSNLGDNTGDSSRLESLVDFLCGVSEPGNMTSHVLKEMSLEEPDTEQDTPSSLTVTQVEKRQNSASPQHIAIEMLEESSFFSSVGATIATNHSERSPVTSPFIDYLTGTQSFDFTSSANNSKISDYTSSANNSKGSDTKDSQAFCDDLIDINFDEEQNIQSGPAVSPIVSLGEGETCALLTSDDWTDVSGEYLMANSPNDVSFENESSNISQLDSSLKTSQGSLDYSFKDVPTPGHQKLTVDLKRGGGDLKNVAAQLKRVSPELGSAMNSSGKNSLVNDSLCSATEILEKSHDSLSKSVHGLSRRAIIKQSNVSLELVLPTEKPQELDTNGDGFKCLGTSPPKTSVLNVQINSSITYPPSEGQVPQKVKRD
jgi:hypothetical protein